MLYTVFNVLFSLLAISLIVLFTLYWFNEACMTLKDVAEELKEGNLIPLVITFLAVIVDTLLSIFMIALIFHLISAMWWLAVGSFVMTALIVPLCYNDW